MRIDIIVSSLFLILLAVLVNPGERLWMPSMRQELMVGALAVIFAMYAVFFWKEKSIDERENLHRLFAGRVAFFVGAGVLTGGIAYQTFYGMLDPWLAFALGGMILAKAIARIWGESRQ